jgi:hypothetical protein
MKIVQTNETEKFRDSQRPVTIEHAEDTCERSACAEQDPKTCSDGTSPQTGLCFSGQPPSPKPLQTTVFMACREIQLMHTKRAIHGLFEASGHLLAKIDNGTPAISCEAIVTAH